LGARAGIGLRALSKLRIVLRAAQHFAEILSGHLPIGGDPAYC
jgi:hypothetical protein